ncbi:c-type cytochrome [Hymenobacter latericus]|uniref:c-type cytochrome n=1 Tax=Hymenobacter sp. YIM 151858-1 TaxID=2987688 RepID=UPI0022277223|nr:cytochrome c [Hymenobacter sp. YIM 151858-1]UYZ57884.1 cytochrome c [Hymenobacter sp. YIM 151858-1]
MPTHPTRLPRAARFALFAAAHTRRLRGAAGLLALAALGACSDNTPPAAGSPEAAGPPAPAAAAPAETALADAGKTLFLQNCALCHGENGKLGLNGARDLTRSNLNQTGREYIVTHGLGKMPSFKGQLTPEQISQVVAYSLTLR